MGGGPRLRVNLLCVIGFVLGVIALILTDSGSWFLDADYWAFMNPEISFRDLYWCSFAAGSVLVVLGVMVAMLSQVGGYVQLIGHVLLLGSTFGTSMLSGDTSFVDLFMDGLWLSFAACAVVILSSLMVIWYAPDRRFHLSRKNLRMSERLLAVSPSDPSRTLRLNLVSVVGSVACGIVMFLPWFTLKYWTFTYFASGYGIYHHSLIVYLGEGGQVGDVGFNVYFVLAVFALLMVGASLLTTLAGLIQIVTSCLFIIYAYANDDLGWERVGLHFETETFLGVGVLLMIVCGVAILLSSWRRIEIHLIPTGPRMVRCNSFCIMSVYEHSEKNDPTRGCSDEAELLQKPMPDS